jgi:hypothetical protein
MDLAVVHFPDTAEYYVLRARAYLKQKEIIRAFEDVNKALCLNPRHKEALEIKKFLL